MTGRAVLVTGASRGIGRAIAVAFAKLGDRVAVHHRDSAPRGGRPGRAARDGHTVVQADLADPEAVRRAVDAACAALGGLDVLVNNAGVFTPHPITEVSYAEWQAAWQATLGVNLIGAANVTWCAVQHMIAGGGGRIVNVSSRGAFRGEPGQPAYGASKAGLNAFGQSLARALAPHGIAVASVAPGFVDTDMAASHLAGPAGTRSGRRARSAGWRSPRRSRRPWCTWPPRRPNGPAAPSSTSTARPTCVPSSTAARLPQPSLPARAPSLPASRTPCPSRVPSLPVPRTPLASAAWACDAEATSIDYCAMTRSRTRQSRGRRECSGWRGSVPDLSSSSPARDISVDRSRGRLDDRPAAMSEGLPRLLGRGSVACRVCARQVQ